MQKIEKSSHTRKTRAVRLLFVVRVEVPLLPSLPLLSLSGGAIRDMASKSGFEDGEGMQKTLLLLFFFALLLSSVFCVV